MQKNDIKLNKAVMAGDERLKGFCHYLIECERSPNTIRSYLLALMQFFTFAKSSEQPDMLSIIEWKQMLMQQHSPSTVNLRLSAMRSYCKHIGVPCDVKLLKIQRSTSTNNVITLQMYERLIDGLLSAGNRKWVAYYKILAMSGVRCNELLNIRKGDLDRHVMKLFTKGKMRRIIFPAKLVDEVHADFEGMADSDFICVNYCGERLTQRGVRAMLKRHALQYGIPQSCAHPHAFRHLFAIEFLKRNKNLALLADLLGHSNVNTTSIYLRLSQEQQQQALDEAVIW